MALPSTTTFNLLIVKPLTWQSAYKYAKGDYDLFRVSETALQAIRKGQEFQPSIRDKISKAAITFILCIPVINILAMAIILNKRSEPYQRYLEKSVQSMIDTEREQLERILTHEKSALDQEYQPEISALYWQKHELTKQQQQAKKAGNDDTALDIYISQQLVSIRRNIRNLEEKLKNKKEELRLKVFQSIIEDNFAKIQQNIVSLFPERKDISEKQIKNDILKIYELQIQRERQKNEELRLALEKEYPFSNTAYERKVAIVQEANKRYQRMSKEDCDEERSRIEQFKEKEIVQQSPYESTRARPNRCAQFARSVWKSVKGVIVSAEDPGISTGSGTFKSSDGKRKKWRAFHCSNDDST